jgi:hypothetical protein
MAKSRTSFDSRNLGVQLGQDFAMTNAEIYYSLNKLEQAQYLLTDERTMTDREHHQCPPLPYLLLRS